MPSPTVTIGVANYGGVSMAWAQHTATMINSFSNYGITYGGYVTANSMAADINRNDIVKTFLESKSDYLFFIDADNLVPFGGLRRLLDAGKEVITGLYFLKREPHTPIAYWKNEQLRGYEPIHDYNRGELVPIAMAGMGATLIYRGVFEEIQNNYEVFQRANGSLFPIHKALVKPGGYSNKDDNPYVENGYLVEPVRKAQLGKEPWPHFYLEYGRTEDVVFYEHCIELGIQPYVDTSVECPHIGNYEYNGKDYRNFLKVTKEKRKREAVEMDTTIIEAKNG